MTGFFRSKSKQASAQPLPPPQEVSEASIVDDLFGRKSKRPVSSTIQEGAQKRNKL